MEHKQSISQYLQIQLTEPRSDYVDCQSPNHHIADCNALQRIVHILSYYEQQQQNFSDNIEKIKLYEYISLIMENYNIPMLMEDWYQCKNNHLRSKEGIGHVKSMLSIDCKNIDGCGYATRHRRNREW
eukprot:67201_1